MNNLKNLINEAETNKKIGYSCFLDCSDITNAQFFDPFMHVYLFDKVFIDKLLKRLSDPRNPQGSKGSSQAA